MLQAVSLVFPPVNMGRATRNALHLALFFCILTTSLAMPGCRSGGIRVRSWTEAVTFAQTELGRES